MVEKDDIQLLQQLISHGGTQAFSLVPAALKKVVVEEQWRQHTDRRGKPFASFEAFVMHPLWQGLESTIDDLRVYCRKYPEIERLIVNAIEPLADPGHPSSSSNVDNVNKGTKGGNSATYTLKRLKRDHPELFQQVLGGAMSVNAAAVEAGFRKKRTPVEIVLQLLPKLSDEEFELVCQRRKQECDEIVRMEARQ